MRKTTEANERNSHVAWNRDLEEARVRRYEQVWEGPPLLMRFGTQVVVAVVVANYHMCSESPPVG